MCYCTDILGSLESKEKGPRVNINVKNKMAKNYLEN